MTAILGKEVRSKNAFMGAKLLKHILLKQKRYTLAQKILNPEFVS
jgi:hypothetical protein